MHNIGTKYIETKRLILRQFKESDIDQSFKNWTSDENVARYVTWKKHQDIKVTEQVIGSWIKAYSDPCFYQWAIVLKDINEVIGSISVVDKDCDISSVTIGYCIGSYFWHQGYTSEAFKAVIDYFFNELSINRIEARHHPLNINSGKVMVKCGLKYEGLLRQVSKDNCGNLVDNCIYSIIKSDWDKEKSH